MKNFNTSYSGRVCEYEQPPYNRKAIFDGSEPPKRTFKHTTKSKNKIKDAFHKMLDYKKGQILFLTFTYQTPFNLKLTKWNVKDAIKKNAKKKKFLNKKLCWNQSVTNNDLTRMLKYLRNGKYTKKDLFLLNSHCGIMENTKMGTPHYHILIDLKYKKKLHSNFWSNNIRYLNKIQRHWNTITKNEHENSVHWEIITKKDFENSKRIYELCSYFTKYFSKATEEKQEFKRAVTFISNNIRTKPITIKNNHFLHGVSVELYRKRIDFSKFKKKKDSQNPYFTENVHSMYDSEVYFVNPKLKTELSLYNIFLYEPKGLYESLLIAKMSVFVMKYIYNLSIEEKSKNRKVLQAEKERKIKKNKKDQLKIKNFLYIES